MAEKRTCIYLSYRDAGDSPPGISAEFVYENLILPAMERFPSFSMGPRGYIHDREPGKISTQLYDEMLSADLVISDLSELSSNGYYEIGLRHAAQLPTVMIADDEFVVAVNAQNFQLVRYPFSRLPHTTVADEAVERLVAAIKEALELQPRTTGSMSFQKKRTPKELRTELATRIEETADMIAQLRINSTGDAVEELRTIANDLMAAQDDATPSALKEAGHAVVKVLLKILDQLATVRGARLAISGAIALVLGGTGLPAVAALGIGLAYWEGKETFVKAVQAVWGKTKLK